MRFRWMIVPAAAALVHAGCSGEDLAESVIERQIESESGEDVDIDFEDGEISIQTEDGEIVMQSEDGEISIQTEDGEIVMQSDGDQTVIQSDDGEIVMQSDGDETTFQSEDGEVVIGSSTGELPDDFPSEIPLPDGLAIEYTQSMSMDEGQSFIVGGNVGGDIGDVMDEYVTSLEAAGFTQLQLTTMPEGGFFAYDNGTWGVGGSVGEGADGAAAFVITVTPAEPG